MTPPEIGGSKYKQQAFLNFTSPPLGLAYLAAYLREHGYESIRIFDSQVSQLTLRQYQEFLKKWRPDFLGIQVLTPNHSQAIATTAIAKDLGVPCIALGGMHPTFLPRETLKSSKADIIIKGEGEETILEVISHLEAGKGIENVAGLAYRDSSGNVQETTLRKPVENLDSLPFPARDLLPMDSYKIFGSSFPATTMISSRGCPYGCEFCTVTHFYGRRWRIRSPKNVVEEMNLIRDQGYLAVAFVDDLFAKNPSRVRGICREITKQKTGIFWGVTARADSLDLDTMHLMRRSGCRMFFIGVESGDQQILNSVKKKTTLNTVEQFFHNSKKARIDTIASIAFGFPGETKQSVFKTIKWVINTLDPSLALFASATPYPGTPFYEKAIAEGWINTKDFSKFDLLQPVLETSEFSPEELKELLKYAYRRFYFRASKAIETIVREIRYALESYGLKHFVRNGLVQLRGLRFMQQATK
ncbi:MAG: B12-binding domain-containing radical SAM protein [Candidatus Hodarchaeota archaeon]